MHNTTNNFDKTYEQLRVQLNNAANEQHILEDFHELFIMQNEMNKFSHAPYIAKAGVGLAEVLTNRSLNLCYNGIDYAVDYRNAKERAEFSNKQKQVSGKLMGIFSSLRPPQNYIEALARQKYISNINPYILDKYHQYELKNLLEQTKVNVNKYQNQDNMTNFQTIIQQNSQAAKAQKIAFNNIDTLLTLVEQIKTQNSGVLENMAQQDDVLRLINLMQAQGIEVSNELLHLLQHSDKVKTDIAEVLEYMRAAQASANMNLAYDGINDACQFIQALASMTNSRELAVVANITQQGVQIVRSFKSLLADQNFISFAALSPYAAIGMAVLNIISSFKNSASRQQSFQQLVLKQLAAISKQIKDMQIDITIQLSSISDDVNNLLKRMNFCFDKLEQSFIQPAMRNFDDIKMDLMTIEKVVTQGMVEILLSDLQKIVSHVDDLRQGKSRISLITKSQYEDLMRRLRDCSIKSTTSEILNGRVYSHLLSDSGAATDGLMKLLNNNSETKLLSLISLLIQYGKTNLEIEGFQGLQVQSIFNPEVWNVATNSYVYLNSQLHHKFNYDAGNQNIVEMKKQGELMEKIICLLQTDKSIYKKMIHKLSQSYKALKLQIDVGTETKIVDLVKAEQSYNSDKPINPNYYSYQIPADLFTKQFPSNYFNKEQIFPRLAKLNIVPPKIFLIAESLGLGKFTYQFIMPGAIEKEHHKSHKNHKKIKIKKNDSGGFKISYHYQGEDYPLFEPINVKKGNFNTMEKAIDYIIKNGTKCVISNQKISQLRTMIQQHLQEQAALSVNKMINTIKQSSNYHQFNRNILMLRSYLMLAGFPYKIYSKVQELQSNVDLIDNFNKLTDKLDFVSILPSFEKAESTLKKIADDILNYNGPFSSLALQHTRNGLVNINLRLEEEHFSAFLWMKPKVNVNMQGLQMYSHFSDKNNTYEKSDALGSENNLKLTK